MTDLDKVLSRIVEARERYDVCKLSLVSDQTEILRDLSVCYSVLTDMRIELKNAFNSYYFQSKGGSHAAKEREAEQQCPELYKVRRVMDSTKVLIDTVRSTLSAAKS